MITELCMSMGWGFEAVLAMKMPTFAMFVRHSRKIEEEKLNRLCFEMCDVVGIAISGAEYQKALKHHYLSKVLSETKRKKLMNPKLFNASDKEQADQAAMILAATFRKKRQLMGLGSGR